MPMLHVMYRSHSSDKLVFMSGSVHFLNSRLSPFPLVQDLPAILNWLGFMWPKERIQQVLDQVNSGTRLDPHNFIVCMRKVREHELEAGQDGMKLALFYNGHQWGHLGLSKTGDTLNLRFNLGVYIYIHPIEYQFSKKAVCAWRNMNLTPQKTDIALSY